MGGVERIDLAVSLDGWGRRSGPHPVRMGVPLAKGLFREPGSLTLFEDDLPAACDLETLARWSDGSLKWILLRFQASARDDGSPRAYRLSSANGGAIAPKSGGIVLRHTQDKLQVDTGPASFTLDRHWLYPIGQARVGGKDLLGHTGVPVLLEDGGGNPLRFRISSLEIEFAGESQADIFAAGELVDAGGAVFCRGECRLFFFAGTALVKIEFALWNPKPAAHASGLWDLGDPGSVRFRACRFAFPLASETARTIRASLDPDATASLDCAQGPFSVHQSSSGNETWRSASLVDRDNKPTPLFRGFRADAAGTRMEGDKANPALVSGAGPAIALAMEDFWQTFPNRLSADAGGLTAEPFPLGETEFELQGGEMAPCAIWLDFDAPQDPAAALACARKPVTPRLDPSAYSASGCIPYLAPGVTGPDPFWSGQARAFVEGDNCIFARQERFEEFGWRNFGEFPADHEKEHYRGSREFVSHYNNQYDFIQSCLLQFAGTGDARWFRLAAGLGSHVMHVDLYRTDGDKNAYNGGYFWHTAHYLHAGTGTHRCYSRLAADGAALPPGFGGGPSNEHNYTSGLLLLHYLTGDRRARRCVSQLAAWVEGMQDGSRTPFRFLSANPTGLATATRELSFQGPGRGAGNSINACLDAASLTGERRWLVLAESLMRSCLGPGDDPEELGLMDREGRWSYIVFLQSLGKFLDAKRERNEFDEGFRHARDCLLMLAGWMAEKEYPFLDKPEELEFPTSTWAAQDLRKMCVFLFAARYAPPEKEAFFRACADRFLSASKAYLGASPDRDTVRNMALMLATLPMQGAAARDASWNLGLEAGPRGSARGERPMPQKLQAMARAKRIIATLGLAAIPIAFELIAKRRSAAGRNRRPRP